MPRFIITTKRMTRKMKRGGGLNVKMSFLVGIGDIMMAKAFCLTLDICRIVSFSDKLRLLKQEMDRISYKPLNRKYYD